MAREKDMIREAIGEIKKADIEQWAKDIAVGAMKEKIYTLETGMLIIENDSIDIDTVDMVAITHKGSRFCRVYKGQEEDRHG